MTIVPGNPRYELKVSPIYKALREGDSGSE